MRQRLSCAFVFSLCALCQCQKPMTAEPPGRVEPHRSPIDLVLLPAGRVVVANHTSDTVSLLDLRVGKVLDEAPAGRKPAAIAVSADGKEVAVSNHWSHDVTLFALDSNKLVHRATIAVGSLPRGLVFSKNGAELYVAASGDDEIVTVDLAQQRIARRWPAPREPRTLALSRDGKWLAAASSRSAQVRCWNLQTQQLHWERQISDAFNLRGLAFTPDGQHVVCAHVVRREFPVTRAHIEEGWVIDSRLTRLPLKADAVPGWLQIALDVRGEAVGDPHGLAFSPDGKVLAVAASGTHELIILRTENLRWNSDPGDFIDGLLLDGKQHRRIRVGGRPLATAFSQNDALIVATYLNDSVQVIEPGLTKTQRSIGLGGPKEPSLARQGEALFYDARRSHNQWFSCHTCHADGHTSGMNFDTLNDDSFGTPKLTPTLRNVAKTGPWTWHGWQKDLHAAVAKSFTDTMYGPPPSKQDVQAVIAYLETLEHPPAPKKSDPAIARGGELFADKAKCARCHRPPLFTSPDVYDVKLDSGGSPYEGFNPPSLLGLKERGPYLHDGRAATLEDVLRTWHTPRHIGGAALTEKEERDLLAFLRSL